MKHDDECEAVRSIEVGYSRPGDWVSCRCAQRAYERDPIDDTPHPRTPLPAALPSPRDSL